MKKSIRSIMIVTLLVALVFSSVAFAYSHSHNYGSWVTTKSPTCSSSGTKARSCMTCGSSQTGTISATGHSYGSYRYSYSYERYGNTYMVYVSTCSRCGASKTKKVVGQ